MTNDLQYVCQQTSKQMWKFKATKTALYKNSVHRNSNGGRDDISFGPIYTIIKYAAVKANVGQYADIRGQSATRSSEKHSSKQLQISTKKLQKKLHCQHILKELIRSIFAIVTSKIQKWKKFLLKTQTCTNAQSCSSVVLSHYITTCYCQCPFVFMPQMDNEILHRFHLKHNIEALFLYSLGGDKILQATTI